MRRKVDFTIERQKHTERFFLIPRCAVEGESWSDKTLSFAHVVYWLLRRNVPRFNRDMGPSVRLSLRPSVFPVHLSIPSVPSVDPVHLSPPSPPFPLSVRCLIQMLAACSSCKKCWQLAKAVKCVGWFEHPVAGAWVRLAFGNDWAFDHIFVPGAQQR